MSVPLWCLLGGVILPYIWAGVSVPFRNKQLGSLDLAQPRLQAAGLTEGGAGAWGAQMNQWEALSVFMAATLMAYMQGVPADGSWALASVIWLVARLLHGVFYVLGQAVLRVACFVLGLAMSIWIVVLAATVG
ncbi:MAG: MAPEG family protein [Pseudomonadota bacterium]